MVLALWEVLRSKTMFRCFSFSFLPCVFLLLSLSTSASSHFLVLVCSLFFLDHKTSCQTTSLGRVSGPSWQLGARPRSCAHVGCTDSWREGFAYLCLSVCVSSPPPPPPQHLSLSAIIYLFLCVVDKLIAVFRTRKHFPFEDACGEGH